MEIGVTVSSTADDRSSAVPSKQSPWGFLGLCSAEPKIKEPSFEDARGSEDNITVLLARLAEQDGAVRMKDEALREKDKALCEKYAEIARMATSAR